MKELYEKYEKVFLGIATVCMLYLVFVKYSSIASAVGFSQSPLEFNTT